MQDSVLGHDLSTTVYICSYSYIRPSPTSSLVPIERTLYGSTSSIYPRPTVQLAPGNTGGGLLPNKALLGTIIAVIGGVVALILVVIIALRRKKGTICTMRLAIQSLDFLNVASTEIRWENEGSVQTLIEMENLFRPPPTVIQIFVTTSRINIPYSHNPDTHASEVKPIGFTILLIYDQNHVPRRCMVAMSSCFLFPAPVKPTQPDRITSRAYLNFKYDSVYNLSLSYDWSCP